MKKCEHGWERTGQCCCNCKFQTKLMKHPFNQDEMARGSINDQMGYVCSAMEVIKEKDEEPGFLFFDKEHGMCEMHTEREPEEKLLKFNFGFI